MLVQRREMQADRECDRLLHAGIFSDSSPVTGEEFQGMILETVDRDHACRQHTLPGSSLAYGQFDAVSKGVCLLWALWLVAGPFFCDLNWMLSKIGCICTDFGIEIKTIELPFILTAFLAWLGGRELSACRPLVDTSRRLFWRALRISGWSHAFGNLMKHMYTGTTHHDRIDRHVRALCIFMHNTTWRKSIKKRLQGRAAPDIDLNALDHWTATLVKWRYESIDTVTLALSKVRSILQTYVREEMFGNAQDRAIVVNAMHANADKFFWTWCTVSSKELWQGTEGARHWGMVCPCEEHVRDRAAGKKVEHCWANGRRLRGSWDFVCTEIQAADSRAWNIRPEECEGDREVWRVIKAQLQLKASGLRMRFHYLSLVPWAFSRADTPEGAAEAMRQVRLRPLEEHDPLVQMIVRQYGGMVDARAQGEDAAQELVALVEFINLACLNEGAGESYHRGTTQEKTRAPASATEHLKQHNRFNQEHRRVTNFLKRNRKRGKRVIRFEWMNWKRVLQSEWTRRWDKKKITARAAFQRLYHDDDMARQDWPSIVEPETNPRPVVTDDNAGNTQLENEYLDSVFLKSTYYGCPEKDTFIGEDGQLREEAGTFVFEVLGKRGGHSRPHLMPTFASADEVVLTASCALEVQPMRIVKLSVDIPTVPADFNNARLARDGLPYWIDARMIGSMDDMVHNMNVWRYQRPSDLDEGIMVASECQRAKPAFHPLDDACPTLCVLHALRHDSWVPKRHTIVTTTTNVHLKEYDDRVLVKFKPYYQVLYCIDKTLPLTTAIPSQQPVKFYKLLLRGQQVLPYLTDKEYTLALNKVLHKGKKDLVPLETTEAVERSMLPFDDDDGIICGEAPEPKAKPKARPKQNPGTRRGRGSGDGRGSGGAAPVPPIHDGPPASPDPIPPVPPPVDPTVVIDAPAPDDDAIVDVSVLAEEPPPLPPVPRPERKRGKKKMDWQDGIGDTKVVYDEYVHPVMGVYKNYIIQCQIHHACEKSRKNIEEFCRNHGAIEPLAYLYAWLPLHPAPNKSHPRTLPSKEQVDAYVAGHRVELEELVARIGPRA